MSFTQNIYLAADTILLAEGQVLLIQRKNPPFQGQWAFPGGFVDEGEDLAEAAARELKEETGVEVEPHLLYQVGAFGKPGRDPRFQTVSVVYFSEVTKKPIAKAADDAAAAKWFPITDLPALAFDHGQILQAFLDKLSSDGK